MGLPNYPEKYGSGSVVTPEALCDHFDPDRTPVPERIVLSYQRELLERVVDEYEVAPVNTTWTDCYLLEGTGGKVGIVGDFGFGAPQAALVMEDLIVRGGCEFVSVGLAGSLQPETRIGDLVVVERALRDEGTSHHYLPSERYVAATESLTERLANACAWADEPHHRGDTWTTDAIFRETAPEIAAYHEEGIVTVDMEAAATFAVAEYRGVAAGALFTISDHLEPEGWEPQFVEADDDLLRAFDRAVDALK
jgi:uridine phosphorylase